MNKRRLNVSPSQVKKFETCARLTSWQLCTRVKPPPSPPDARALGERAHALVERWLLEGERPDPTETIEIWRKPTKEEAAILAMGARTPYPLGQEKPVWSNGPEWRVQDRAYVGAIALAHIQTVPPPKHPGLEVEVSATVTTPAATYKARADYRARINLVSTIGDHKFVGDLSYALTNRPGSVNGFGEPNYLGDDVQALIQAKAEFEAIPDLSCVALAWHYTQTKAVRGEYPTRVVRLTLTREQVNAAMEAIDPVAAQIATVFDLQIQPHALPPRLAAAGGCDRIYGRPCEFTSHCNLTPPERQDQHMNTPITSQQRLAEALENAKRITAGSFANAAPVAPSAPPAFVVPTFAPPPAFAPPSFQVPIIEPPEASTPPAFVVPNAHVQTASAMFNVPISEVTEEQRIEAKRATFGQSGIPAFVVPNLAPADPINPPEAPPNDGTFGPVATAKRVEEVEIPGGDIDALDRAAAKKICVQRGLVQASSRLGVEALRDLIRKNDAGVPIERVDPAQFVPSVEEVGHIPTLAENVPNVPQTLGKVDISDPDNTEIFAQYAFETLAKSADLIGRGGDGPGESAVIAEGHTRKAIDDLHSRIEFLERRDALVSDLAAEVRAALDDLNRVGDRLRSLIGA